VKNSAKSNLNIANQILIGSLTLYQKTLSPDHGLVSAFFPNGVCRYQVTCSEYMIEKIKENGAIVGLLKGTGRILSCNPFTAPQNKYNNL